MPSTTVMNAGIPLVADVLGEAHARTVIFLHTGGESRSVWHPIAAAIVGLGWRTVAADFRGHGESGRSERYRLDDLCEDTLLIARRLAGQPCVVVGGSLGGIVGMLMLGELGFDAAGLVLLDIGPTPRTDAGERERRKIANAKAAGARGVEQLDPRLAAGSLVSEVLEQRTRIQRAARNIAVPVTLVHGSRSHVVGAEELEGFRQDIQHGDTEMVDAGHLVAREQPAALTEILARFLDGIVA